MNAIVRLPAHAGLPVLSLQLERQVSAIAEPSRYAGAEPFTLNSAAPRHDPAAASALPQFEHACRAPDPSVVVAWLSQLAAAVGNSPSPEDFRERANVVVGALADLPACVWTSQTLAEASRSFRFWPSVAELDGLLRPRGESIWRRRDALRRIAEARPGATPSLRPDPTDAEREQVRAAASALVAELRAGAATITHDPRAAPKTRHLSDGQLLAIYERDAREHPDEGRRRAAETRATVLRERLSAIMPDGG